MRFLRDLLRRLFVNPSPYGAVGARALISVDGSLVAEVPLTGISKQYLSRVCIHVLGCGGAEDAFVDEDHRPPYAIFTFSPKGHGRNA